MDRLRGHRNLLENNNHLCNQLNLDWQFFGGFIFVSLSQGNIWNLKETRRLYGRNRRFLNYNNNLNYCYNSLSTRKPHKNTRPLIIHGVNQLK